MVARLGQPSMHLCLRHAIRCGCDQDPRLPLKTPLRCLLAKRLAVRLVRPVAARLSELKGAIEDRLPELKAKMEGSSSKYDPGSLQAVFNEEKDSPEAKKLSAIAQDAAHRGYLAVGELD